MKSKKKILLFYILIFYIIFIMTLNYPDHPDEYMYSYIFGTDIKIFHPFQLIISLKKMYFEWSGRIISNFLQQFFIYLGKDTFVILNSFTFISIIYFSFKFIFKFLKIDEQKEFNVLKVNILTFFYIWFYIPAFSQDFIWMVGSANYSWPLALNIMLIFYFNKIKDDTKFEWKYILLLLLVAISNESSVVFTGIYMFVEIVLEKIKEKKFSKNKIKSMISFSFFSLIQILSPGNAVRIKNESEVFFPKNTIFEKVVHLIGLNQLRILLLLLLLLLLLVFVLKLKKVKIPVSLLITSILNLLVFVLILPRNENRALLYPIFGLILFLVILSYQILDRLKCEQQKIIISIIIIILFISVVRVLNYYSVKVKELESIRKTQINYYRSIGEKEAILEKYGKEINNIPSQHKVFDFLETFPDSFSNLHMGKYFEFEKLYAVDKGKKLLIVKFSFDSKIETLRFDMYGSEYSALYNFNKTYLRDDFLFLEIPQEIKKIDIKGEGFIIKEIKILKMLGIKEFESHENLKHIEIKN